MELKIKLLDTQLCNSCPLLTYKADNNGTYYRCSVGYAIMFPNFPNDRPQNVARPDECKEDNGL